MVALPPFAQSLSKGTLHDRSVGATLVVAPLPIALNQSKGTLHDRSVGATLVVALPRTPSPSATPHPDTASLPPRATLRYLYGMKAQTSGRYSSIAGIEPTDRFVARALRVSDGAGRGAPQGGGLFRSAAFSYFGCRM